MTESEWYSRRNNRINNVEGINLNYKQELSVCIVAGNNCINTYSGQVMLLVTINLFSRWCNQLNVKMPTDVACLIPNYEVGSLTELIENAYKSSDPFGKFNFTCSNTRNVDIILCVGNPDIVIDKPYYWISADNWISGFGYGEYVESNIQSKTDWNPIGACFSACLGASIIFERFIDSKKPVPFTKHYSLYDFQSSSNCETLLNPIISQTLNIGNIYQVGCGAVGSSFSYLLKLLNVSGSIQLIDFDTVEVENLCSSLLFNANDAFAVSKKVEICENILSKIPGLKPEPHDCDYSEFINKSDYIEKYPELILCFANERSIWSTIQHNLPPIVYHATTTPNWGINFGRHIPLKEWCIVCRFGTENYEYTPVCSNAVINHDTNEKEVLGVLPFLSPASAILTLAEVIKLRNYSSYPINNNFIQFMVKVGAEFRSLQMSKKPSCPICSMQEKEDYTNDMRRLFEKY